MSDFTPVPLKTRRRVKLSSMALSRGLLASDALMTTAMISDSLDHCGSRNQVASLTMTPAKSGLRALGRARTAKFVPANELDPAKPYDAAIDFIDGAEPGDLIVLATDESNASAFWGELFSAAALGRGCVGMITDGNFRDVDKIAGLEFPAFARSSRPIDFRGRMVLSEKQIPVTFGSVIIHPGDIIAVDDDGVAVIPQLVEQEVLEAARARARKESTVLSELLSGATLREVWTRHGIL